MEPDIQIDEVARIAIGAAIEVHRELGPGYLERVYEEALAAELALCRVSFERQKLFALNYKKRWIGEGRLDFLIADCLVLEIKAVDSLLPVHKAQVLSYLKATKRRLGLLINFNERLLKTGIHRIIWSPPTDTDCTF